VIYRGRRPLLLLIKKRKGANLIEKERLIFVRVKSPNAQSMAQWLAESP